MKSVFADRKTVVLLLLPALLFYTAVKGVPVLWSFALSFFQGDLRGFDFVGLDNFAKLFTDAQFGASVLTSVKYAVIVTIGQVLLGYLLALFYVFVLRRSSAFIRTIIFFPTVLPTVAIALLFKSFFEVAPRTGPVNAFLGMFGIESIDWLGQADSAFIVIVIMELWASMGFYAVLLYAGLLDIPEELIESARLDGANGWQVVRNVVLPLSAPVLLSAVIFSFNATLKVFDSIYALTQGGPGTATQPLTLYMFKTTFTFQDYGYGSTLAVALTVMCLLVTVLVFGSARKDRTKA
ncbi:carbohydrate ABC transporter permease [Microbacterium tumbae]